MYVCLLCTVIVVHLADIKFGGDLTTNTTISLVDQPRIASHSALTALLKTVLVVTLVQQLKKNLPNCQIKNTIKCTTPTVSVYAPEAIKNYSHEIKPE